MASILPERFTALRKLSGLTQDQMGDLLGISGKYVGMIERGEKPIEEQSSLGLLFQSHEASAEMQGRVGRPAASVSYGMPKMYGCGLRLLREQMLLKSREVAEKIGVAASHYSEIENDRRPLGPALLERLAEAYGMTTEDLKQQLRQMSSLAGDVTESAARSMNSLPTVRETEFGLRAVTSRAPDSNALAAHLVSAMPREEVFRLLRELTAAGEKGDTVSLQKARALLDLIPECHPAVDAGSVAGG